MTIPTLNNAKSKPPVYTKLAEADVEGRQHSNPACTNQSPPIDKRLCNGVKNNHRSMFIIFLIFLIIAIVAIVALFILSFQFNLKIKAESWPFLGHHMTNENTPEMRTGGGYDSKLIIKYKLENSKDETTVYRNFRTGYETLKSRSPLRSVCYIKKMEMNDMRNSTAVTNVLKQKYKSHFYNVVPAPKEAQKGIDWLVGKNVQDDCSQSSVLWIEPMQYQEYVTPSGQNSHNTSLSSYDDDGHKLDKRSIRSCRHTCCWRVCCCDVHHFSWQVDEEFNCSHVCNKCSPKYKSVIQRMC